MEKITTPKIQLLCVHTTTGVTLHFIVQINRVSVRIHGKNIIGIQFGNEVQDLTRWFTNRIEFPSGEGELDLNSARNATFAYQ
jgi:hypothetical protein